MDRNDRDEVISSFLKDVGVAANSRLQHNRRDDVDLVLAIVKISEAKCLRNFDEKKHA